MDNKNIKYTTSNLTAYYGNHRRTWEEFYESERSVLEDIIKSQDRKIEILDVGCGCGGLGEALSQRYDNISYYCGVDINENEIAYARQNSQIMNPHNFICADIALLETDKLYDIVISFSCIDWNIETDKMLRQCWNKVKPGGYFIISLRLTNKETINDINKGYQHIVYDEKDEKTEIANYVVFNWREILEKFQKLKQPANYIKGYGYWGKPSDTAVIQYDKLCFMVFSLCKCTDNECQETIFDYRGPISLLV